MKTIASKPDAVRASHREFAPRSSAPHGGLRVPNEPHFNVLFALSLVRELAALDDKLVIATATGFRPVKAEELRERLVAAYLAGDRYGQTKKEALERFPLWAVESVLLEGEWEGVRKVEASPDDQAEKTLRGLTLLRDAITSAPREAVTTNWLLANRGPVVNEAMRLLRRQVTARNLGHLLRDLGASVGIWCAGRLSYGSLWTVGEKPGRGKQPLGPGGAESSG